MKTITQGTAVVQLATIGRCGHGCLGLASGETQVISSAVSKRNLVLIEPPYRRSPKTPRAVERYMGSIGVAPVTHAWCSHSAEPPT